MGYVRTLIVDDHKDVRFLIRTIVADADLPVEVVGEADGVEAALEQLAAPEPDAVVLDARMPRPRAAEAGIRAVLSKDQFDEIPRTLVDLAG